MRRLSRDAGFKQPLCTRRIHGCRVDFVWPEHKHEPLRVAASRPR
jgi:hypothetical protein